MQYVRKRVEHTKQIEQLKAVYEKTLLQSQIEIQEHTLRSISHEIHDNIGQILSLVSLNLNTISSPEKVKLDTTNELVNKAITDLRSLSKSLNPEMVQQIGLRESLSKDLAYLQSSGKYETCLHVADDFPEFAQDKTIIIYRIIQEIINNCIKHAKATAINVYLFTNGHTASITVEDNGIGFDFGGSASSGLGLQTIQFRAAILGASITINSKIGKGTTIVLTFNKN
jgi:signal transduction histidine kinase